MGFVENKVLSFADIAKIANRNNKSFIARLSALSSFFMDVVFYDPEISFKSIMSIPYFNQNLKVASLDKELFNHPSGYRIDLHELRQYLSGMLPNYMLPDKFKVLDSLPVTISGKVDKRKIASFTNNTVLMQSSNITTFDPVQEFIANIWLDIIGQKPVSLSDNFFDLGGGSLYAIQILSRINSAFSVNISLQDFFADPTVRGVLLCLRSNVFDSKSLDIDKILCNENSDLVETTFAQKRVAFVSSLSANPASYNVPCALTIKGNINIDVLQQAIEKIVQRHLALRLHLKANDNMYMQSDAISADSYFSVEQCSENGLQDLILEAVHKPFSFRIRSFV